VRLPLSQGALSLAADAAAIDAALSTLAWYPEAAAATKAMVHRVLRRSCYLNLWKLMGDQLTEETYLRIVRNKILIDVQGEDVLMQIFTSVVLQREAGTEAPFLEFIQRVCAQCSDGTETCKPIRPGCGGFGIRNFLTLFLSIEVSKAMLDGQKAADGGREAEVAFHHRRVKLFTEQLVPASLILTQRFGRISIELYARAPHSPRSEPQRANVRRSSRTRSSPRSRTA